jgi:hypothetical protein
MVIFLINAGWFIQELIQQIHGVQLSPIHFQQSGSRIYQSLNDYIYTAGGDLAYKYNWLGHKQTVKGGYMLQIKDRLYDAVLFANNLHKDNDALKLLPDGEIFRPENFGDGSANSNLFAFDALIGNTYRYLANTNFECRIPSIR